MPFTISVPNKNDVALLGEMPEFVFKYKDMETGDEQELSRNQFCVQSLKEYDSYLNLYNIFYSLKNYLHSRNVVQKSLIQLDNSCDL